MEIENFYHHNFWELNEVNSDSIAIITEDGTQITYQELNKNIDDFILKLPQEKSLFFIKLNSDFPSLLGYLALLRSGHPFLILDSKVDDSLIGSLYLEYKPNYILENLVLTKRSEFKHKFHSELSMLLSTSGSTGSPKLVRLSRNNLQSNTKSIVEYLAIQKSDRAITTLPMSYSYGLSIINSHLLAGATIIINQHSVISREFWQAVKSYQVTTFAGVPFTFQILKKLKYERFDTSSIRYLTQAGGKLDDETLRYYLDVCSNLSQHFVVMYGQTEASPRISYLPSENLTDKIGSIGIAIPSGELSLRAEYDEKIVTPFIEGEIIFKGPNVMLGYAESVTDLALGDIQGGVLKTGDIGYFDNDGYYYITGRAKRFIKMFGLRISLDTVDSWLEKNDISAVSVGVDDTLTICLERNESILDDKIKTLVSKEFQLNINNIKVKRIDEIPRNANGKIDLKRVNEYVSL